MVSAALVDRQAATGTVALMGISCPSVSLCVAVDSAGNVVTSGKPAGGASAWTVTHVDPEFEGLSAVSCPSVSFCVAVGPHDVASSTNPAGGASAWTVTAQNDVYLAGVSCGSPALCVAITDGSNEIYTSRKPTDGASAWTVFPVTTSIPWDCGRYTPTWDCQARLTGVSCMSNSLCVAVDGNGDVITSRNPTAGPSAWAFARVEASPPGGNGPTGISCASPLLCVAVETYGATVFTSRSPTGGVRAWTAARVDTGTLAAVGYRAAVACGSVSLCAETIGGEVLTSTHPTGGRHAWFATAVDAKNLLAGVACASTSLCVGVDGAGNVIVGVVRPTAAQIGARLRKALAASGKAARIVALLKHGGYSFGFRAPEAGRLVISWYAVPRGAHLASGKPKSVLVASGTASFAKAGTGQIKIRVTQEGKQLLENSKHLKLASQGSFRPIGQPAVVVTDTFMLKR